jgi:hypothetical protein
MTVIQVSIFKNVAAHPNTCIFESFFTNLNSFLKSFNIELNHVSLQQGIFINCFPVKQLIHPNEKPFTKE